MGTHILLLCRHVANYTECTKPLVILNSDHLSGLMIVAGGMHRSLAPAIPEGNLSPRGKWAVPATMLLHGRKLSVYMRLEAGGDFSTTCTQETACQMSDFPSGGLPGASQKGTGVVVKYYSLTFYLLRDQTGAK